MKKANLMPKLLVALGACFLCNSLALAQATRTWISGVGDDANPCSRTAPCKTFAGAISKTAAGGEIDALDPGGFGVVTITKAITIDGGGVLTSILSTGTNGITINAGAGDVVTIRNIRLNGGTTGLNGIKIIQAKVVNVDSCEIFQFLGAGGFGILDTRTAGGLLSVQDTIIRNNAGSGISILPASGAVTITASISNTRMQNNGNSGLAASNGSRVTVSNSIASGNADFGFYGDGPAGASELNIESSVASGNGLAGISVNASTTIRISNVHITNNGTGVGITGGSIFTYGNNRIGGNAAGNNPVFTGSIGPQ